MVKISGFKNQSTAGNTFFSFEDFIENEEELILLGIVNIHHPEIKMDSLAFLKGPIFVKEKQNVIDYIKIETLAI